MCKMQLLIDMTEIETNIIYQSIWVGKAYTKNPLTRFPDGATEEIETQVSGS